MAAHRSYAIFSRETEEGQEDHRSKYIEDFVFESSSAVIFSYRTAAALLDAHAAFRTGFGGQVFQLARLDVFRSAGFNITASFFPFGDLKGTNETVKRLTQILQR